jgi:hypothetical protein
MAIGLLPAAAVAQGLGGVSREETHRRSHMRPGESEARTYSDADLRTELEAEDASDDATDDRDGGAAAGSAETSGHRGDGASLVSSRVADRDANDHLREELDRAADRRKERERTWRQRVAAVRAKLFAARKEHDVACNPGSIALRGG